MIRTQLYLTDKQRAELAALGEATGKRLSELVREALDRFLQQSGPERRGAVLDRAAGMWKDRGDLPDFRAVRRQWDRG
jgi:hypothetical protein